VIEMSPISPNPSLRPEASSAQGNQKKNQKRRRHLIDPDNPPRVRDRDAAERDLTNVQRWVMSSLAVTTLLHLTAGLILAAMFLPEPTLSAEIGLNLIGGAFAVIAVAVALAIHGHRVVSWWLLLGLLPTTVGLWLTLY
jgi:hypothetical protein